MELCRLSRLADLETPVTAYLKLAQGRSPSFLLESAEGGKAWSRYSMIGVGSRRTYRLDGGVFSVDGEPVSAPDPLAFLYRSVVGEIGSLAEEAPFLGGAVGYASYDLIRSYEKIPNLKPDRLGLPELLFFEPELVAVFDHFRHQMILIAPDSDRLAVAEARLAGPLPGVPGERASQTVEFQAQTSEAEFKDAVRKAIEYIKAGDIFQVVPSVRFSAPLKTHPFAIYRALRALNPSPYMGYLELGPLTLVAASPESLLRSRGSGLVTRPIAGTRPISGDPELDSRRALELLADPKERAEHAMLVDLSRNDLGRVARYGSVKPQSLFQIETYSHVMHLVSTIEAELAPGKTPLDALASVLPMGTVSGAPKIRAMEIIEELEPTRRGPYGGSFGYVSYSGDLDMALTLRTAVATAGEIHIQAGAGIVADSDPESEYQEVLNKAQALFRAVELASRGLL